MTSHDHLAARRPIVSRRFRCWALALLLPACNSKGCAKDDQSTVSAAAETPAKEAKGGTEQAAAEGTRKESNALGHLPDDCLAVARVQWAKLAAHPALSPHLRAAYDPPPSAQASVSAEQKAFLAFLQQAQIDPTKDVTQLALCLGKNVATVGPLVALGGNLPGDVLGLMKRHAPKGGSYEIKERDGIRHLELDGQHLAQAADNAVLLGRDFQAIAKAYPTTEHFKAYALPEEGELAIVARGEFFAGAVGEQVEGTPLKEVLPHMDRFEGTLNLQMGHLTLAAKMDSPELATKLEALLKQMTQELIQQAERAPLTVRLVMAPNVALARKAKFRVDGDRVSVHLDVPEQMVESLMTQVFGGAPNRPPKPPPGGVKRPQDR